MEVNLLCLFLLASALTVCVQSAPHEKQKSLYRRAQHSKEKDDEFPKINDSILPTFFPFEASSPEPGDEDVSTEKSNGGDGTDEIYSLDLEESDGWGIPVLLSEEMLAQLIKASEEEQHGVETDEEDSDEDDIGKVVDTNVESVEITPKSKHGEEKKKQQKEKDLEEEEVGSSTDSEIPVDLDYAADSVSTEMRSSKNKPLTITFGEEEKLGNELPTVMEDYDTQPNEDYEDPKDERDEKLDQAMPTENLQDKQILPDVETETSNTDEDHESRDFEEKTPSEDKEEGYDTNESVSHFKEKLQTQRESKSLRKGQSDQVLSAEVTSERSQDQEAEITFKKRGKWASFLGMNPVQIRAAMDLFPRIKPTAQPKSRTGADPGQEASVDSCENFHCKRGKTCKLNNMKEPSCVCQEPADCPPSLSGFDHVCGTDNQTYDSYCQLFAIKCSLEGSKKGHRLHLDYTGSCKFISPCLKTELIYFPLRMRDWMKNVLLQLYEQDFLTAKQRSRVQKMYEDERRLHAGDHPDTLLARDFEKNYSMYVYPVHWQFAQLDQHPSDRFLSHSELAPLRAPLVPMEHCTSVFFHQCDADKDKLISFREWCQCFGIKDAPQPG
ncbi:SPARC-like protein 1 [Hemibagrus wyckioides]|uniref:SPARC-like protein 1 n=1 Tax=Hemibagrus wyckioides TaxID=337641 RepID=UPI00266BDE69|nr:SPARC-like protein 1 [Hemibagrus wyckioides]